ncbi:MAG: flagellar biosynthesis anti-sigma factor FlgM [Burkholderiales bacterium]|nr:flagellar biosynthesis anti-sigma factor FlgM [Burkholderiales bacterium]
MKVGQPADLPKVSTPPAAASGAAAPAKKEAAATATSTASSSGVAVTVSTTVRSLEQANRSEAADIDTEKVNAVRQAIKDGTYVVNPEVIADKLLSNAQEMLNRTQN